jgi:cathepsin B
MMKELMTKGPVTATFSVWSDIAVYKKGVYDHVKGEHMGMHAIKIVGWGVYRPPASSNDADLKAGVPYWIIVNSWNENYGDNGILLLKRGKNECGLENEIYAAMPDFSKE